MIGNKKNNRGRFAEVSTWCIRHHISGYWQKMKSQILHHCACRGGCNDKMPICNAYFINCRRNACCMASTYMEQGGCQGHHVFNWCMTLCPCTRYRYQSCDSSPSTLTPPLKTACHESMTELCLLGNHSCTRMKGWANLYSKANRTTRLLQILCT